MNFLLSSNPPFRLYRSFIHGFNNIYCSPLPEKRKKKFNLGYNIHHLLKIYYYNHDSTAR